MALLKASFLPALASFPLATRYLCLGIVSLSAAHLALTYLQPPLTSSPDVTASPLGYPYLVLIPGLSYYFPWTLVTAGFVETSIPELLLSLISISLSVRYLERLWGALETVKFAFVVVTISNLVAFALSWLEFVALGNAQYFLYGMCYRGTMALQAGILVAFTQLIPEHHVQLFGVLKIRVKRLPMLYVTFSTIMCLLTFQAPFILIQFGWLVSWIYLRFYKRTTVEGVGDTYGDRSETFAFVTWFPPFLHKPISFISGIVYNVARRLHIVPPHPGDDLEASSAIYSALPGGARAEAERRRALALRALDQRMPQVTVPPKARTTPAIVVGNAEQDLAHSAAEERQEEPS